MGVDKRRIKQSKIIMAIFEKQHYGQPLNSYWEVYINLLKKDNDINKVADKHGYTPIMLSSIIRGSRNLTEKNSAMIIELIKVCMSNYVKIGEAKEYVNEQLIKLNTKWK